MYYFRKTGPDGVPKRLIIFEYTTTFKCCIYVKMLNHLIFSIIYLTLDIIWLSSMTGGFYRPKFEKIQQTVLRFRIGYACVAYFLLLATLFFICIPLTKQYPKQNTSLVFSFVGLCIYGIYNATNGAVLSNYGIEICLIDTLWGCFSFAFMGYIYKIIYKSR